LQRLTGFEPTTFTWTVAAISGEGGLYAAQDREKRRDPHGSRLSAPCCRPTDRTILRPLTDKALGRRPAMEMIGSQFG